MKTALLKLPALFVITLILNGCSHSGNVIPPTSASDANAQAALIVKYPELRFDTSSQIAQLVASGIPDSQIDANIDPLLQGADRDRMRKVMTGLPPWSRRSVTYFGSDGRGISNINSKTIGLRTYHETTASRFENSIGQTLAVPSRPRTSRTSFSTELHTDVGAPAQSTNSGPYRQVYYYPTSATYKLWYNTLSANIPCGATRLNGTPASSVGPYSDQGYVYTGGYSNSGNDSGDFGVIYSPANQHSNLYFSLVSINTVYADSNISFPCGDWLAITFSAQASNANNNQGLSLEIQAYNFNSSTGGANLDASDSIIAEPSNLSDWMTGNFLLKGTVSLAQQNPPNPPGYVDDGYEFGIDGSGNPQISMGSLGFDGITSSGSTNEYGIGDPNDPQQGPSIPNSNSFTAYSVPNTLFAPSSNGYAECGGNGQSCTPYAELLNYPPPSGSYYEVDGINADSTPSPTPKPKPTATPPPVKKCGSCPCPSVETSNRTIDPAAFPSPFFQRTGRSRDTACPMGTQAVPSPSPSPK